MPTIRRYATLDATGDVPADQLDNAGAAGPHAADHEDGGSDEIDVTGLVGVGGPHPDLATHDGLGLATDAELTTHAATAHGSATHEADAADAHDASAVSVVPVGGLVATDVQAALAELDSDIAGGGHAEDHDHDGAPAQKLTQANTHESPDTDTGPTSLHHTIGAGANQAASGTHTHTPIQGSYTPGSFTVATGNYAVMVKSLQLTTTQRLTLQGTARLRID